MNNAINQKDLEMMRQEQNAPYIRRTIDGREYTVKIHFHPDSQETASEKLKRIMLNDIKSGVLQEEIISENMPPIRCRRKWNPVRSIFRRYSSDRFATHRAANWSHSE